MSITYTEQTITIKTVDGEMTITAQVASNGLAYHHTAKCGKPDCDCVEVHPYSVTHVASGLAMPQATFVFPSICEYFIQQVNDKANWKDVNPELPDEEKRSIVTLAVILQDFTFAPHHQEVEA